MSPGDQADNLLEWAFKDPSANAASAYQQLNEIAAGGVEDPDELARVQDATTTVRRLIPVAR